MKMKSEVRNPKSERNLKPGCRIESFRRLIHLGFGLRPSGFIRISGFGLRHFLALRHSSLFLFAFPLYAQSPRDQLPPLAAPYGKIPPTFWEQHGAITVVCGFLVAGITALLLWLVRRPKVRSVVPPEVLVRQALARWLGRPEDGGCLDEISQSLRRYFVAAFQLPIVEFTTAEICQALAASEKIGAELAEPVGEFLRECDRRRFAPTAVQPPLNAAARALELVTLAETRRAALSAPITSQP